MPPLRSTLLGATCAAAIAAACSACTLNLRALQDPPRAAAVPTAFPWESMEYVARTDAGVLVIDLGWYGSGGALRKALRRVGATPQEVTDVFLTHSHRDHIGAWRRVPQARFHLFVAEAPLFTGQKRHVDLPSRVGRALLGDPASWPGEVAVQPFGRDTAYAFGRDTLRAFELPGHTAGSAAYLFRRVLFVGDALFHTAISGWNPSRRIFTANGRLNAAALASLRVRVAPYAVDWICTAHAKCARADSAFWAKNFR